MLIIEALFGFLTPKLPMMRLLINSTASLLMGVVAQAVGFVILARYLGTAQFGHLVTIAAVAALANTWCGFGPGEVLRRVAGRDRSMYPNALGHTVIMISATGVILSVLVTAGLFFFLPVGADSSERLQILLLLVPSSVMLPSYVNLTEYIFLAHNDFTRANLVNGGFGVLRALAAIVACGVFGVVDLRSWAIWWACVHVGMCFFCLAAIWRFGRPRWRILRKEVWLGGNLSLSSFLIMLRHNIDILVLSALTTPDFVGVYGAGRRLIGAALVVPGSFDRLIYGKLAAAGKNGPSATQQLAKKYLVYSLALSGATSVSLFLVAPYTSLVFGPAFSAASDVIRILSWTVIPTAVQFLAFDAINAAEHHRVSALVSGIANVAGAAMVVGLGSLFGTSGIYAALYLSDITRGGALWFALNRLSLRHDRAMVRQADQ
jgi:O-antigen/teichoic acid export membrane protein